MGIVVAATQTLTSQALGTSGTANFGSVAFTSGRALLGLLHWGDASSLITVSALNLGTDGAMTQHPNGVLVNGPDTRGSWFFIASNSGTQTISAPYSGTVNSGIMGCTVFELTGAPTGFGSSFATDITNALTFGITPNAGDAVFVGLQGGGSEPGTVSGGGGAWTSADINNSNRRAWVGYNTTINGGAQTLTWDQGDWAYAIVLQATPPVSSVLADFSQFPKYQIRARAQGIR